jgi:hypothetical protein
MTRGRGGRGAKLSIQRRSEPLTPAQASEVARRLALRPKIPGADRRAVLRRQLQRAGVVSAVVRGVIGNKAWGRSMHRKRGGHARARHQLHQVRAELARAREIKARRRAYEHGR